MPFLCVTPSYIKQIIETIQRFLIFFLYKPKYVHFTWFEVGVPWIQKIYETLYNQSVDKQVLKLTKPKAAAMQLTKLHGTKTKAVFCNQSCKSKHLFAVNPDQLSLYHFEINLMNKTKTRDNRTISCASNWVNHLENQYSHKCP